MAIVSQKNITEQALLEKQLYCINIALKNEVKYYSRYADILLFNLDKDESYKLLLQDSKKLNDIEVVKRAVQLYELCAKETGARYCLARTTEAYYYGIGVEKNKTTAAAWAKITSERAVADDPFKTIRHAHEINHQLELDFIIRESELFKQQYYTLQQLPMP